MHVCIHTHFTILGFVFVFETKSLTGLVLTTWAGCWPVNEPRNPLVSTSPVFQGTTISLGNQNVFMMTFKSQSSSLSMVQPSEQPRGLM